MSLSNRFYVGAKECNMYLVKTFTFKDNNHTICTFDLFSKEGAPILIESVLESDGSRAVHTYDGYDEVSERLWVLDLTCDGTPKADRAIHALQHLIEDPTWFSK